MTTDTSLNNPQLSTAEWFTDQARIALRAGKPAIAYQLLQDALAYVVHYQESKAP